MSPHGDVTLRSPDRLIRLGLVICVTTLVSGPLALLMWRYGLTGGGVLVGALAISVLVCCRIARESCTSDALRIHDRRTFRTVSCAWADIGAVSISTSRRESDRSCVRLHLRTGHTIDLLATRCRTATGTPDHAETVHAIVATLETHLLRTPRRVTSEAITDRWPAPPRAAGPSSWPPPAPTGR